MSIIVKIDKSSGKNNLYGYALDTNNVNDILKLFIEIEGNIYPIVCDKFKEGVFNKYGNGYHGFKIEIPVTLKDGKEHIVKILDKDHFVLTEESIRFQYSNLNKSTNPVVLNNLEVRNKDINPKKDISNLKNRTNVFLPENSQVKDSLDIDVSIIIAAYNCEDYIDDCINSLINQTIHNFEIICVDDGSTDTTLTKLRDYEKKYDYIRVITQKNSYAGVARNNGMRLAKGKYLLFLDADDFFEPTLVEEVYQKAVENDAEIVVFNGQEYDTQTKEFHSCKFPVSPKLFASDKTVMSNEDFGEKLFQANSCLAWNKLIKSDFARKIGVKFGKTKSSNDTVFVYTLLSLSTRIVLLDKVLANYRVNNPKSLQRSKAEHWETLLLAFFELKKTLIKFDSYSRHKRSFVNKILQSICYFLSTIDESTQRIMESALNNKYFKLLDITNVSKDYIYNKGFYTKLQEIKSKLYIPIVYATNDNYAPYMSISIQSIIDNLGDSNVNPIFYVCIDDNFSDKCIEIITNQVRNSGFEIKFLKANKFFDENLRSNIDHISVQAYYRLAIPTLLSYYDKVIYLDCDTIVNGNIKELYDIDISKHYVGGVIAPAFANKKHTERLQIDTTKYINSGVLLINNRLLIKDKVQDKFLSAIGKFACMDQDVINYVCHGKILNMSIKYNLMTKYYYKFMSYLKEGKYTQSEYINTVLNPFIIHYADKIKPWNDKNSPLSSYFFMYSLHSPFNEMFISYFK